MNLHNEIMNIGAKPDPDGTAIYKIAYKQGHRDARHAAAEMSLRLECQRDQLREALSWVIERAEQHENGGDMKADFGEWLDAARAALKAVEEG